MFMSGLDEEDDPDFEGLTGSLVEADAVDECARQAEEASTQGGVISDLIDHGLDKKGLERVSYAIKC